MQREDAARSGRSNECREDPAGMPLGIIGDAGAFHAVIGPDEGYRGECAGSLGDARPDFSEAAPQEVMTNCAPPDRSSGAARGP